MAQKEQFQNVVIISEISTDFNGGAPLSRRSFRGVLNGTPIV
jgi:hypothetical protein